MNYSDDNYGQWGSMDDPDMQAFFRETQATNVEKECAGCGNLVKIQSNYAYCNRCATKRESGWDF